MIMIKTAGVSKGMAQWIEDFIVGLNKDKLNKQANDEDQNDQNDQNQDQQDINTDGDNNVQNNEFGNDVEVNNVEITSDIIDDEKTAAINVYDLPKVVWNDETFYVLFDEETGNATILNQFTNVVTTIKATTIEEVNDALNGLQIVSEGSAIGNLKTAENDLVEQSIEESQPAENELTEIDDTIEESKNVIDQNDNYEDLKDNVIDDMKQQINDLNDQITILKQQYARIEELQNLDLGCEEAEVQHFNESARETEEQINEDNQKDITTPEGRSKLREKILNDLNNTSFVNENQNDLSNEEPQNENLEAKPLNLKEPSVINEQEYMMDSREQPNKLDDFSNNDDKSFEILNGKDVNIFKKAVCPKCGGNLLKVNANNLFQGIICNGECHSEYAVNLNDETIYRKMEEK